MSYLEGLNEPQKKAVLHTDGPLLIVAGAGAGKTRTITHRIAHLIESGVPAYAILAVTFTNKAAGEMRERIEKLLEKKSGAKPFVTTFHALGVRILREFYKEAGVPRSFSIWDRDDSTRAIKRILEKQELDYAPRGLLSAISREKGQGETFRTHEGKARNFRERIVSSVWKAYEEVLAAEGALDFDDLLLRTLKLLSDSADVRARLQHRWSHITIDEYQDTNRAQYEIARLLTGEKKNICVVGDIDQNIYSWRGADIEHLLNFEKTFPGASTITLEQNYRSTRTILAAAQSVIEKNIRRKAKTLFTENETGEALTLYGARNEMDEAWFVAMSAQQLMEAGTPASEIAVLYRENFQSRAIEEAFLALGLSYRVLGTRFFERKEVKDLLSYLRFALNPQSTGDLARIIGVPSRGIGKTTLEKMISGTEDGLPAATRAKVSKFRETIRLIRHAADTLPASETVRFALETSGLEKMFNNDREEGHERLGNVQELVNLATRYDHLTSPEGIDRLLEEAALVQDQDELDKEKGAVSLMTMHASKGLEFDAVFVTGLEQGLFPSAHEDEHRDSEEERRLFYVALTRARKRVFLSFADMRTKYGSREHAIPSEFLKDIDQRLVEYAQPENTEKEQIIT